MKSPHLSIFASVTALIFSVGPVNAEVVAFEDFNDTTRDGSSRNAVGGGLIIGRRAVRARRWTLVWLVLSFTSLACHGSIITWGNAQNISGDTDVAVNGTSVYAYSMGSEGSDVVVNGVTFGGINPPGDATGTVVRGRLSFVSWNFGIHATIFGSAEPPFAALSANYREILQSGKFDSRHLHGTEGVKVVLNGLTDGKHYQVQLWANVSLAQSRIMNWVGDGGTAGSLSDNPLRSIGGVGQHIIGTFTASGTSQDLNLSASDTFGKINALSLRMTNAASIFGIIGTMTADGTGFEISWPSVIDRFYRIEKKNNLNQSVWDNAKINIMGTPPANTAVIPITDERQSFYRVAIEPELWGHLTTATELEDVRDMVATFDDSGARRVLKLNVSNPVSWAQGAWVAVPPPTGGWDLAHVQNIQATIENTGGAAVEIMLWVVGSNGWSAIGDQINLQPGQGALLSCNLRQTYPDGTPKIDPGRIKNIRIMTQRATSASLEVTGLTTTGSVGDWVRPAGRLEVPDMVEGVPAPGRRVRYQLAADAGTDIYCALYLPTDWQPGKSYPVIVETPGNYFYSPTLSWSTGRPEQCAMGYGISSVREAIWVSLPFVDRLSGTIAENGFGSNGGADTVRYMQDVIDDICQNWRGDSNNLFLCGFSRGAIACGYIGLANDEIAKLWKGFIACQHYDGSAWNQSNMDGAIERAPRFQGEAIFQVDNSNTLANFEQLMEYTDPAVEWTWVSSGLGYHSTAMFLDDRAMMIQLRQWFRDLTAE